MLSFGLLSVLSLKLCTIYHWKDLFKSTAHSSIERDKEILAKCIRYDVLPDTWWDEREILQQWAIDNKTTWVEGQDYSELCLEAGMRSSKCLRGSSLVYIKDLGHVRLDELLPKAQDQEIITNLAGMSVQTRYGFAGIESGISMPIEKIYNIRSRYGYELGGSYKHPILTINTEGQLIWKKLPDITSDDYMCIERTQITSNNFIKLT